MKKLLFLLLLLPVNLFADSSIESRLSQIEARLAQIESIDKNINIPQGQAWQNADHWRNELQVGMTKARVRELFGEPTKQDRYPENKEIIFYGYPQGGMVTLVESRVVSWVEPDPRLMEN